MKLEKVFLKQNYFNKEMSTPSSNSTQSSEYRNDLIGTSPTNPAVNSEISKANYSNVTAPSIYSSTPTEVTKNKKESFIKAINTKEEFNEHLKSIKDKYVIVEFYAVWCGPCKMLGMIFEEVAQKYQEKVSILKIDIDDLEELAIEYEVNSMPSFMIMWNGEKLEQYFGSKVEQVNGMVKKYLEKSS